MLTVSGVDGPRLSYHPSQTWTESDGSLGRVARDYSGWRRGSDGKGGVMSAVALKELLPEVVWPITEILILRLHFDVLGDHDIISDRGKAP